MAPASLALIQGRRTEKGQPIHRDQPNQDEQQRHAHIALEGIDAEDERADQVGDDGRSY
jgi:hypothetical protein